MMNTQASINCINEDMLSRLASGECSPNELSACEEHVSQCQQCRDLLDSRAIDEVWNEQLLPAFHATECNDELTNRAAAQQAALNLLGPTDDPHMLGRIGSYEVVGLVGIGGMGIVFKAFDAALNRFVAIKMMQPHLAVSGAARQRFEREGRAAAAVISDFVLPIYAVSEWQGVPYLVMQYMAGMNLQKRMEVKGPLQLNEILRVAMQTARGLAAAHAQGLVHRDVKPSNILLDGSVERAMLTDFGLARAVDDASVTRTGLIAGTPQYMSPEQVRGDKVDVRSDQFSLGSTMYAMCTGHPPFRAEASYAVLHRIVGDTPRSIREVNADIPEWLDRIVMKLLSKSPGDRFASADQIAELLEGCLAHVQQPTSVRLPEAISRVSAKRFSRGPLVGLATVLGLLSLMFAGVLIVLEMNKGTLTIECDADDIPIKIVQGDKVVETMTVSREGKSTRIAAGKYTVELDQAFDHAVVADGVVTISRGGVQVVKVKQVESPVFTVVSHKIESLLDTEATAVLIEQQMEPLIELIRSAIDPDSWSSSKASIVPYPQNKSLVVTQTPAAQTAIAELLAQLDKQVADNRSKALPFKSPSPQMKDQVDGNLDPQTGVFTIRGESKQAVERTAAVIDKIKEQQSAQLAAIESKLAAQKTNKTLAEQLAQVQVGFANNMIESLNLDYNASKQKLDQAQKELTALKADLVDKENQLRIAEEVSKQGIISKEELFSKTQAVERHRDKVLKAKNAAEETYATMLAKEKEIQAKKQDLEIRIQSANQKVHEEDQKVREIEKELIDTKIKFDELGRNEIVAPRSGIKKTIAAIESKLASQKTNKTHAEQAALVQVGFANNMIESLNLDYKASKQKWDQAQKELTALKADLVDKENQLRIAEEVSKQGLIPKEELFSKTQAVESQLDKVLKAKNAAEEAHSTMLSKEKEIQAKKQELEIKIQSANQKVLEEDQKVRQIEKELIDLKTKFDELGRNEVVAPRSGIKTIAERESPEMKDHVDVKVDTDKKQFLNSNPCAKLFDAIASASNAAEPTPIPKQLFLDCFKDRTKENAPISPPNEATFLFKSIKKATRSEQSDDAVTYEFDVDSLAFIEEVVYLGTGDKTVAEAVLGGLRRDPKGPRIDAKKVLRENLSKRVKLTCDFHQDGTMDYLVEMGVIDVPTFMPIFQRFFESEPKYLANEAKDFYSLLQPSSNGTPSTTRFGATVFNSRLYWGSLEKVEQVRDRQ